MVYMSHDIKSDWYNLTSIFIFFSLVIIVDYPLAVAQPGVSQGYVFFPLIYASPVDSCLIVAVAVVSTVLSSFMLFFPSYFFTSMCVFRMSFRIWQCLAANIQSSPIPWSSRYLNFKVVGFSLSMRLPFSNIVLNPLVNACVTLKILTLKSDMYTV